MEKKSYTTTIEVQQTTKEVFDCIKDISKWWGGKDFTGNFEEFTIYHVGAHFSKQKLIELIPDKKIVWHITESTLHWLEKNKHEWKNTKLMFEIIDKEYKTELRFTHEGLVPQLECYTRCAGEGWSLVINGRLFKFITEGKQF